MRLIDGDALSKETGKLWEQMPDGEELSKELMKAINRAPTVDAVPVVRCRDCKYAHMTHDGEVKYCDRISMPDAEGDYGYALYLPGDWFCADGERREDDAKEST